MKPKNTIRVNGKRIVCRIFDNGGESFDRYTIALRAYRVRGRICWPYLASSEFPSHPQGFGQYGESAQFVTGKHLGKRIAFESLPLGVQQFILQVVQ